MNTFRREIFWIPDAGLMDAGSIMQSNFAFGLTMNKMNSISRKEEYLTLSLLSLLSLLTK